MSRDARGTVPWGRPGMAVLLMFVAWAALLFTPRLASDSGFYFEYLRSAVVDGDLSFWNEREHHTYRSLPILRDLRPGAAPRPGYEANVFAVGPALSWLPAYLAARGLQGAWNLVAGLPPGDGYGLLDRYAMGLTSLLCGFLGVLLLHPLLTSVASSRNRVASMLLIFSGSMAPAFCFVTPGFAHTLSLLATTSFLLLWRRLGPRSEGDWFAHGLLGAWLGIMTLARWQSAAIGLLPLADTLVGGGLHLVRGRPARALRRLAAGAVTGLTALVMVTPQLLTFRILYGGWVVNPMGGGGLVWGHPRIRLILLDPMKGLFTLHPLLLVALLGLPLVIRRDRRLGLGLSALFLIHLYVNSIRYDWAGVGFGMRRFIACLPAFVAGFAALLEAVERRRPLRKAALLLAGLAIPWNLLLMAQYYLSELGAPWQVLPAKVWLLRQFTLAPRLLPELLSSSLVVSGLRQGIGPAAIGLVLLTLALAALALPARALDHPTRPLGPRGRAAAWGALVSAALLVDLWLLGVAGGGRILEVVDLTGPVPEVETRLVAVREGAPLPGQRGGLSLGAELLRRERIPRYERDLFLAEPVMESRVTRLEGDPEGWLELHLPAGRPCRALELVTRLEEGLPAREGAAVAELEIPGGPEGHERWPLRLGLETESRLWRPSRDGMPVIARTFRSSPEGRLEASYFCRIPLELPREIPVLRIRTLPGYRLLISGLALEPAQGKP